MTTVITAMVMAAFVLLPPITSGQVKDPNDRGRKLYAQYCASCHGIDASGRRTSRGGTQDRAKRSDDDREETQWQVRCHTRQDEYLG
jgi:mono/diheme cytochrome c family protein